MAGHVDTGVRTFTGGAALNQGIRVVLSSGKVVAAALGDFDIGTTIEPCLADGDLVPIRLRTASGTEIIRAAGAVTAGAVVYTAADGEVSATDAERSGRAHV